MPLPTVATVCALHHRAIAFLGDDCPLCSLKMQNDMFISRQMRTGHIWPFADQLQAVLRQQFTLARVDETARRAWLPNPYDLSAGRKGLKRR